MKLFLVVNLNRVFFKAKRLSIDVSFVYRDYYGAINWTTHLYGFVCIVCRIHVRLHGIYGS